MSPQKTSLIVGTRGSKLALTQSQWVCARLMQLPENPIEVKLEIIETVGDRSHGSLTDIGGQGVFTSELERALHEKRIDLAVHSLKDLPTETPPDLSLVATPKRADVRDVLVTREHLNLEQLPQAAVLGTGSTRRRAQLLALRPDLQFSDIRGNVDTRLRKVDDAEVDGVVLAAAGLQRLSLLDRVSIYFDTNELLPAPGQGALGLQMRIDNPRCEWVSQLNDSATWAGTAAERGFLHGLGGGCRAPIAAWGREISGELLLDGLVASLDGNHVFRRKTVGTPDEAADIGRSQAADLMTAGAGSLLVAGAQ